MIMKESLLNDLVYISTSVGIPTDYTQGGGGNTSVKLSDELMAVKASGYKLKDITATDGYVIVNYKNIKEYFRQVDLSEDKDFEKESSEYVRSNVIAVEGQKPLRPSVEAGFHSFLQKYVIHTHSVYANLLCCTKNGQELVERIFKDKRYTCIWIPYINPGFCLTLKICKEIDLRHKKTGKFPQVIFMENHGLIVTSEDCRDCVGLHSEVNEAIIQYFRIEGDYPQIKLSEAGDNIYMSKTAFLTDYFKNNRVTEDFLDRTVLYPDQLVYLNDSAGVDTTSKKLNINSRTGEIIYKAGFSEAQAMEETLLAYLYVLTQIERLGLAVKTMSEKEINFIKNWESEAYRKSLLKVPEK